MAKKGTLGVATTSTSSVPLSAGGTPPPPHPLHISAVTWPKDQLIHRIHPELYSGDQFNPGVAGNARFSPIKDAAGKPIPTIYGGTTFDCAAMETVFHDASYAPGFKNYDKTKLENQAYCQLRPTCDLALADLSSTALRKAGVQRNQLIDTEKDQYPATRQWAEVIHAQYPNLQGLQWTSRQDDRAQAIMLFGDRIPPGSLEQIGPSKNLVRDNPTYAGTLELADLIGVNVVPGKS